MTRKTFVKRVFIVGRLATRRGRLGRRNPFGRRRRVDDRRRKERRIPRRGLVPDPRRRPRVTRRLVHALDPVTDRLPRLALPRATIRALEKRPFVDRVATQPKRRRFVEARELQDRRRDKPIDKFGIELPFPNLRHDLGAKRRDSRILKVHTLQNAFRRRSRVLLLAFFVRRRLERLNRLGDDFRTFCFFQKILPRVVIYLFIYFKYIFFITRARMKTIFVPIFVPIFVVEIERGVRVFLRADRSRVAQIDVKIFAVNVPFNKSRAFEFAKAFSNDSRRKGGSAARFEPAVFHSLGDRLKSDVAERLRRRPSFHPTKQKRGVARLNTA